MSLTRHWFDEETEEAQADIVKRMLATAKKKRTVPACVKSVMKSMSSDDPDASKFADLKQKAFDEEMDDAIKRRFQVFDVDRKPVTPALLKKLKPVSCTI